MIYGGFDGEELIFTSAVIRLVVIYDADLFFSGQLLVTFDCKLFLTFLHCFTNSLKHFYMVFFLISSSFSHFLAFIYDFNFKLKQLFTRTFILPAHCN